MPTRTYPVSYINEGIKKCLQNSLDILDSATILLEKDKKKQAYILYTFAIEEFGKACLLKKNRDNATTGQLTITDNVTFTDHKARINEAKSNLTCPEIKILTIDISQIPQFGTSSVEFKPITSFPIQGDFLSHENRMAVMYVDYENNQWVEKEMPSYFEMTSAFDKFKSEVEVWKNNFESSLP